MRNLTLQEFDGQIVVQEVQREYSEPKETIYRWPTGITAKQWRDNWHEESIGKPVYAAGYGGLYTVTGMVPQLRLLNGNETHCLPVEVREIPKPKRVKNPYYDRGYWRNAKGDACGA